MSLILEVLGKTSVHALKKVSDPEDDESQSAFIKRCMSEGGSKSECQSAWDDYSDEMELSATGGALQKSTTLTEITAAGESPPLNKADKKGDDGDDDEDEAPVGTGERFQALKDKIAAKGKVSNPAAVAAAIGRKKYGKKRFAELGAEGRSRKSADGDLTTVRGINRALRKSADDQASERIAQLRKV